MEAFVQSARRRFPTSRDHVEYLHSSIAFHRISSQRARMRLAHPDIARLIFKLMRQTFPRLFFFFATRMFIAAFVCLLFLVPSVGASCQGSDSHWNRAYSGVINKLKITN